MKSVVTAWKAEHLPYNVQLPVLHVVFLLLSRLGGRQRLGWPVILSHERCEQWFLCAPSLFILGPLRRSEQTLGIFLLGQGRCINTAAFCKLMFILSCIVFHIQEGGKPPLLRQTSI